MGKEDRDLERRLGLTTCWQRVPTPILQYAGPVRWPPSSLFKQHFKSSRLILLFSFNLKPPSQVFLFCSRRYSTEKMGDEMPVLCVALLAGSFDLWGLKISVSDFPKWKTGIEMLFSFSQRVSSSSRKAGLPYRSSGVEQLVESTRI